MNRYSFLIRTGGALVLRRVNIYLPGICLALVVLLLITTSADSSAQVLPAPQIFIAGLADHWIDFDPDNGQKNTPLQPSIVTIPHLVLKRDGQLTAPRERTLIVELRNLDLPRSPVEITLAVFTQHSDHSLEPGSRGQILVWQETRRISPDEIFSPGEPLTFQHEFTDALQWKGELVPTPTDYFQLELRITPADNSTHAPLFTFSQEYAFLMENQRLVALPEIPGHTQGAPPGELILYYCDMFPFQLDRDDPGTRMPREKIEPFLQTQLIPSLQAAFRDALEAWELPWYPEWSSYRLEDPPNRISLALTTRDIWFHGQSPDRGSAKMSISVNSKDNRAYHSLKDSLVSIFYHELFHNIQRSISLHFGGAGDVDGLDNTWRFFSEGTAVLASSVGQPGLQFSPDPGLRAYFTNANGYLAGGGPVERDLNKSYQEIDPYHGAIYWRYLYEQCGGMHAGLENPAQGMQVIIQALHVLYAGEIVDIHASTAMIDHLPEIMDEAIQEAGTCPFADYRESLNQFAAALYQLQTANGRCLAPGLPEECGFYDPRDIYLDLHIPEIQFTSQAFTYDKSDQPFPAGIKSSYGIDFIQVKLSPAVDGKPLSIELISPEDSPAQFNLQVIKLKDVDANHRPLLVEDRESQANFSPGGDVLRYSIPDLDFEAYNRLGIVITRVDNQESVDKQGEYELLIHSNRVQ